MGGRPLPQGDGFTVNTGANPKFTSLDPNQGVKDRGVAHEEAQRQAARDRFAVNYEQKYNELKVQYTSTLAELSEVKELLSSRDAVVNELKIDVQRLHEELSELRKENDVLKARDKAVGADKPDTDDPVIVDEPTRAPAIAKPTPKRDQDEEDQSEEETSEDSPQNA